MKFALSVVYLFTALVAVTAAAPDRSPANCKRIDIRRNIADLTVAQRNTFFGAIQKLKDTPDPTVPNLSIYDKYVKIHVDFQEEGHGTAQFIPWHRLFLRELELELQKVEPSVVMPFWDWSISSQSPERSIVFTQDYFGGNGGSGGCVTSGRFANWQTQYPAKGCLKRSYDGQNKIGAFTAPELLDRITYKSNSYEEFASGLEYGIHGRVHNGIGGTMAQMSSNNDPIFYLHHANVDRLWSMYQSRGSQQAMEYNGKRPANRGEASLDDVLKPFNKTVRQAMDMVSELCYTYTKMELPKPAGPPKPVPPPVTPTLPPTPGQTVPAVVPTTLATPGTAANATVSETPVPDATSPTVTSVASETTTAQTTLTPQTPTPGSSSYMVDAYDRSELYKIRMPAKVPDAWLKMNYLSVDTYAAQEAMLLESVKTYNEAPDVSSVASLQYYQDRPTCDVIPEKVYESYGVPVPDNSTIALTAPIGDVNFLNAEGVTAPDGGLHVNPQNLPVANVQGATSSASSSSSNIRLAGVLAAAVLFYL